MKGMEMLDDALAHASARFKMEYPSAPA